MDLLLRASYIMHIKRALRLAGYMPMGYVLDGGAYLCRGWRRNGTEEPPANPQPRTRVEMETYQRPWDGGTFPSLGAVLRPRPRRR